MPTSPAEQNTLDPVIESLVLSARRTGFAEALNEVTKLFVEVARMDDKTKILITLAKGFDEIMRKGPPNA